MNALSVVCGAFCLLITLTGCVTAGNKKLDPVAMDVAVSESRTLTQAQLVEKFGEPIATKDAGEYTLLGYRKREAHMSAWSIVPFVGLVAGGMNEEFTTCVAKILKITGYVEGVTCTSTNNFQSNSETMVGDIITDKEFRDIFGQPIKK